MRDTPYYIVTIVLLCVAISCGDKNGDLEMPASLDAQKELLEAKKKDLAVLQSEIDDLQTKIISQSPELQEKAKLVDTLVVSQQDFKRYIDIQGRVVADDVVNVVSETAGRIISITASEGEYVSKGQVIATIDLESLSKQKIELETSLSLAVDMYNRQKRLWDQNIGSEVQFLQAQNNKERIEKSLETLDFQLTKATVTAPISGTVDREILKVGEIASPGVPILTRTLKVNIKPAKYNKLLKPNLLAEIKVEELSIEDVIVIPSVYILQQVDGQEYLFTVTQEDNKHRAVKKYVTTSESSGDNIIITEGILSGDILVSKGARNISDGDLIIFE